MVMQLADNNLSDVRLLIHTPKAGRRKWRRTPLAVGHTPPRLAPVRSAKMDVVDEIDGLAAGRSGRNQPDVIAFVTEPERNPTRLRIAELAGGYDEVLPRCERRVGGQVRAAR